MRILVIEDEYISRVKLKKMLSVYGDCDAIHSGRIGLNMFKQAWEDCAPYALITLDIQMPDIDGKDVISTIRQWEFENEKYKAGKEVKILMISAMEDSKNIMGSFREGCEAYLVKPVNADNLKKTLADLDIKA